ncbi:hypothetical protein Acr_28g0012090 [Actinidia rufa]|uniref:Transmembrane protein n=1 Tax=Actinidia rufa TaxID=165716 RepID=A0A7J0HCQ2_9ERIC|nr:hypothetical protein Acr_28g0012090 [Actinidia rufa]
MDEEWVIELNKKLKRLEDETSTRVEHQWKKRSIYKVPPHMTDLNKEAYLPQVVSFGPYHHGEEHLMPMEEHKHRALFHFLKRTKMPLQIIVDNLTKVVQDLKDSYDVLNDVWQSTHGMLHVMPYIRRDMLLLENQLPMLVLIELAAAIDRRFTECQRCHPLGIHGIIEKAIGSEKAVVKLFQSLSENIMYNPHSSMGSVLHDINVYRRKPWVKYRANFVHAYHVSTQWNPLAYWSIVFAILIFTLTLVQTGYTISPYYRPNKRFVPRYPKMERPRNMIDLYGGSQIIGSEMELQEARIRFEASTTRSLQKEISYIDGVLSFPVLVVDDTTESMLLNLIAFERLHVWAGDKGVIHNALESNEAVVQLFNLLAKDIVFNPHSSMGSALNEINVYRRKRWVKCCAKFARAYHLSTKWSPWGSWTLIFDIVLSVVQTVYTIYPYHHPNKKTAYRPQVVSFGPYHHGAHPLMPMEEHKHRALLHFLKRTKMPLQIIVDNLTKVVQDLKDSYDVLNDVWQSYTGEFLRLMVLDGCFMLEVLCYYDDFGYSSNYAPNDPIFSAHGMLHKGEAQEFLEQLIRTFTNTIWLDIGDCLHVLDIFRKSMLWSDPQRQEKREHTIRLHDDSRIILSAMELQEAGIRLKTSNIGRHVKISFKDRVLCLPFLFVDETTEFMFLNLIAFERLHIGAGDEVTSYICFMSTIINSVRDVILLESNGIIEKAIGSEKAVVKLFQSLSEDIMYNPHSSMGSVLHDINVYRRKPWVKYRANFVHAYHVSTQWNPLAYWSIVLPFSFSPSL